MRKSPHQIYRDKIARQTARNLSRVSLESEAIGYLGREPQYARSFYRVSVRVSARKWVAFEGSQRELLESPIKAQKQIPPAMRTQTVHGPLRELLSYEWNTSREALDALMKRGLELQSATEET